MSSSHFAASPFQDHPPEAHNSADEITPIVDAEQGTGRSYHTTEPHAQSPRLSYRVDDEADETDSQRRSPSGLRERQQSESKGKRRRTKRTFLAWLRTSLAFASIGIAVTQLFRLNTTISERDGLTPAPELPGTIRLRQIGKPLGATFLGIAILVLGVGGRRYFESQYWIIRGKFPASRGSVILITLVALALIVVSLVVVCTVEPSQFIGK
ncbi:MAG: hypothetical protein Q9187_006804 [Circinaria calcarea]